VELRVDMGPLERKIFCTAENRTRFLYSTIQTTVTTPNVLSVFLFIHLTFHTGVLHLIQINHQHDAPVFQFIILTFVYSSTCFGHDCHYDTKVKPEAATAVIELLIMGGKTPETC
jgi:hypothetical protein